MTIPIRKHHLVGAALAVLTAGQPAAAGERTYGPDDPFVYPRVFSVAPDDKTEDAYARYDQARREATRWEVAYQVLNAVDTVQTIDCLDRHVCTEANPLFGKRPSRVKLIAGKGAMGVLHWLWFTHLRSTDPYRARTVARWSVAIQGGVVVANARFAF